ncbi:MAG: PspC domain-containing protein [Bacteroidetes bacterium]|nr:PspC domain-containing protein [Bacteroidota bacterium]
MVLKKTITVNLTGILFTIDEDAYDLLHTYLEKIRLHFGKEPGGEEIYTDIETRVSELLQQKLSESKTIITFEDVKEVILVMGQPADMGVEDKGLEGTGSKFGNKRLFRDPEERILGGVASGIAAYFGIDPVIIRLIFVICMFFGFGFLLYLILWIVVPEARTISEKLEMKGQRVNISNIEKSFRKEISEIGDRLSNLGSQARETIRRQKETRGSAMDQTVQAVGEIVKFAFRVILIILGVALCITGLLVLFAVISFLFGWGGWIHPQDDINMLFFPSLFDSLFGSDFEFGFMQLALLLFLGIPLVSLFYSGIRMIFRIPPIRYAAIVMFNIWLISLVMVAFLTFKTVRTFQYSATIKSEIPLDSCPSDTIYLKFDDWYSDDPHKFHVGGSGDFDYVRFMPDGPVLIRPVLRIKPIPEGPMTITNISYARGKSVEIARQNAAAVTTVVHQNDSLIVITPCIPLEEGVPFRGERVRMILHVPAGKYLHFDDQFDPLLDFDIIDFPFDYTGKTFLVTRDGLKEN